MAASYREARQYERASVNAPAALLLGSKRFKGRVTRLGGGGVFIATDAPAGIRDVLVLQLFLPCLEEPLTVKGEVRWRAKESQTIHGEVSPAGIGLMFLDMDPPVRAQIVEFVAETGGILYQIDGLLQENDPDITKIQQLLSSIELDRMNSVGELRSCIQKEMGNYFARP